MSDLISRQAATDAMGCISDSICEQQAIDALWELPAIEAEPVKHGKWIVNNETKEWVTIYCDQCHDGMWNRKDDPFPNYCFNCGARMGGRK